MTEKKQLFKCKSIKKTQVIWENDNNKKDIISFGNWVYELGQIGQTISPENISLVTKKESASKTLETVRQPEKIQPIQCKDVKMIP